MSVSRLKTWIAGEVLLASELNAEFNNILNNGGDLAWPATTTKDLNGNKMVLDSDGDTSITSDTDDRIDFEIGGVDLFRMVATVATPVNGLDWTASAAGNDVTLDAVGSDTDISVDIVPKGAGVVKANGAEVYRSGGTDVAVADGGTGASTAAAALVNLFVGTKGGDLTSASPLVIGTDGDYFDVTGTTGFSAMTVAANRFFTLQFDGALTITQGSGITTPGNVNIVTAAGDHVVCQSTAANTVTVIAHIPAPMTQAQAEAGSDTVARQVSALRVKQAIDALASSVDRQSFTESGTWTKPSSGTVARIECWGGGGSGGKASAGDASAGGGGGGYAVVWLPLSSLGATETVTIAAGGASQTSADTDGNIGGDTTFGAHLTAYGGGGGGAASGAGAGGGGGLLEAGTSGSGATPGAGGGPLGGTASSTNAGGDSTFGGGGGGDFSGSTGQSGGQSVYGGGGGGSAGQTAAGGVGGNSFFGGAGGGGGTSDSSPGPGAGGTSTEGGDGGAGAFDANNATAGSQPGGGGGGSETGDSGAGGDGQCIVTVF